MSTPFTISEHTTSVLPHITFVEEVDAERVAAYLRAGHSLDYGSDFTDRVNCKFKNSAEHVRALFDTIKDGKIKTRLARPAKKAVDDARVYHRGFHSLSQLSKPVRDYLCHDNYDDIDITNCHPSLVLAEAISHGMDLPALSLLVNDRPAVFEQVKAATGCTDKQAKLLAIIKMYGGGVTTWRETFDPPIEEFDAAALPWFTNFDRELKEVTAVLKKLNPKVWQQTRDRVNRQNKASGTHKDPGATLLANYAQCIERRVIDCVVSQLSEEVRGYAVYCYDGLMFPKRFNMTAERIAKLTEDAYPMVKWAGKEFDAWEDVHKFVEANSEKPPDETADAPPTATQTARLDIKYLNSLSLYRNQKAYFEQFVIKVRCGDYWVCQQEYDPHADRGKGQTYRKQYTMDSKRLQHAYGEVSTGQVKHPDSGAFVKAGSKGSLSNLNFLTHWGNDINKRAVMDITFRPQACAFEDIDQGGSRYNTFMGYPSHLFDNEVTPEAKHGKLLDIWREMLWDLVTGDGCTGSLDQQAAQDTYDGVLSFFAHTVMNPGERLEHSLIIQGPQGCCKGTIVDTIGRLVGPEHYISTSKVDDLIGTHAEGFLNRVLVNLDESDAADQKGKQGQMKTIVTMKTQTVNPKHLRPYDIDVFASLILTTNKKNMVYIDASTGERRYIIVNATSKWVNKLNTAQWTKLHKGFQSVEFQKLLFEYLRNHYETFARDFDFKAFKRRNSRRGPYRQLMVSYTPDVALYFTDLLESRKFKYVGRPHTADGEETASIKSVEYHGLIPTDYDPNDKVQKFWEQDEYEKQMLFCGDSMIRNLRAWAKENHFQYSETINHQQFYRKLSELNFPITTVEKCHKKFLSFVPRDLYQAMAELNFLEVDPESPSVKKATEGHNDEYGLDDMDF